MAGRRRFLLACGAGLMGVVGGGATGWAAEAPAPAPAQARPKVSQAAAHYQDHPQDVRSCGACTLFQAPDGCRSVEGKVSPDGFCALFELAD